MKCIDPWLTKNKRVCPICKRKVFAHNEPHHDSDSDSDTDDTTPLIRSGISGTQGGTFEVKTDWFVIFYAVILLSVRFKMKTHSVELLVPYPKWWKDIVLLLHLTITVLMLNDSIDVVWSAHTQVVSNGRYIVVNFSLISDGRITKIWPVNSGSWNWKVF